MECLDGTVLVPTGTRVTPLVLERITNFALTIGVKEPILIEELQPLRAAA